MKYILLAWLTAGGEPLQIADGLSYWECRQMAVDQIEVFNSYASVCRKQK